MADGTIQIETIEDLNRLVGVTRSAHDPAVALSVEAVAERYEVKAVFLERLVRDRLMPPPRLLDDEVRFLVHELAEWENGGCQPWSGSLVSHAPLAWSDTGGG